MFEVARRRDVFLAEPTNALGFLEENIVWFLFWFPIEGNRLSFLLLEEEILKALQHTSSLTLTKQRRRRRREREGKRKRERERERRRVTVLAPLLFYAV